MKLEFPKGFLWGAATASHQIEGGQHNDWSEWEKAHAERLAQESEKNFRWNPHWKKFEHEATDPKNYISGVACDSWNRFEEDFTVLDELHLKAYRFSIEWSRIEPEEGVFDEAAIGRYRDMIASLRRRSIEPFVTLWHWTLPLWLSARGGTTAADFPERFRIYTEKISSSLGSDVKFWITLNEPDVVSSHAYLKGAWPPQEKCPRLFLKATRNLIRAHKLAYETIKEKFPEAQISIAKHQILFETKRPTLINNVLKAIADWGWNFHFLNHIKNHQDFIGLNHYNRNVIDNGFGKNPNERQTDFGWEFFPDSIYQLLLQHKRYGKPIYITENGIADASDTLRQEFIPKALAAVHRATAEGVDVRGYFYWSLLDNFEWDKGYWLRFGLVEVDRTTQTRTIRPSARTYAHVAETNILEE
jgi:beta-glucosidase